MSRASQGSSMVRVTLSQAGITVDTEKLSQMLDLQVPRNKKDLKRLLGSCSFFRTYLPGFCHSAGVLQELLKSTVKFRWQARHDEALEQIKDSLKHVPVLAYPDQGPQAGALILTTDSSLVAAAGFLSQVSSETGEEVLLGCYGRSLRPNEKKFYPGELEILAVILGIEKYKHLLLGRRLIIRSDSKMVRYLQQMKISPNSRHCRWILGLSSIIDAQSTSFEYVTGKTNLLADYLSRKNIPCGSKFRRMRNTCWMMN